MSDVHIIGTAMSFDEIDLWWILNYRIRLMNGSKGIHNSIYYYGYAENYIKQMLSSHGIDVSKCTTTKPQNESEWEKLYMESIQNIEARVKENI